MALIGNQLSSSENNSYRVLDNLSSFTLTFDGSSSANVLASTDTIALSQHPFVTGQRVTYSSGGGSPIGGLLSGTAYYITKTDQNSFQLASSYVNAITNINIDLVGPGTGVTHSFNVAFDGINTKFKATYSNGTKCTISRAPQLDIAINGVVQQPYDSNPPPNGFTIEADATIVFSIAPLSGYTFWGKALSGSTASFETSDNSIDNFTGDGSTTNFTLSKTPANSQNVLVTISGVTQYPSDATGTRSYSTNANVLVFTAAPANASLIQVRYIGFAGPTSSNVTGFYGRTGNVVLNSSDGIGVGTAKIGTGIVGLATALLVEGNVRITGILTIGTSSITLNGSTDTISARAVSTGSTVSIGASTIVVGNNFIGNNAIGLGATTTTGRNIGINTAEGTIIYNSSLKEVQVYKGSIGWTNIGAEFINATGGFISDYTEGNVIYRAHIFTSSGTFSVTSAPSASTVEYLVVAGGGGAGEGGGGAGGFRTGTGIPVTASPGSYSVTVGAGGLFNQTQGFNGNPSVFGPITSTAGGGGGGPAAGGQPGGSGGGGRRDSGNAGGTGNTPPVSPSQGNPGGTGTAPIWGGGSGGGGASSAGTGGSGGAPASETGGNGGSGTTSTFTGISTVYAGGGGGGVEAAGPAAGGQPGPGGGGLGAINSAPNTRIATSGTYATGGGGGGRAGTGAPPSPGGNGGSGIVVVRYQIASLTATAKATGGAISYAGGKTIHTFTSTSTFTNTSASPLSVEYVVVGGGGGGGASGGYGGGGGGAGGYLTSSTTVSPGAPNAVTVQVGAGGAINASSNGQGNSATPSYFGAPIAATGGGGGGYDIGPASTIGSPGGSGGGNAGGPQSGGGGPNAGTPGQGNPGGSGSATGNPGGSGGGGGGAGGAGSAAPGTGNSPGGPGGIGIQLPASFRNPTSTVGAPGPGGAGYWVAAGGGGGSAYNGSAAGGTGGGPGGPFAGAGNGAQRGTAPATGASQNTGSGGGGGTGPASPPTGNYGYNGGSGIVIIAYPS